MKFGVVFLKILAILILLTGILAVVYLLGPRVSFPPLTDLPRPPQDLSELVQWFGRADGQNYALIPGTEKQIVWYNPDSPGRTRDVVVYIHGFSASRQEIDPVPQLVAQGRNANLVYTRLTGHGSVDGEALGDATAADWYRDGLEALATALAIGDRVILIGTSTGVTLSSVFAYQFPQQVAALLAVSPNYGPSDELSWLTAGPWGREIGGAVMGPYRSWTPYSELHGRYWTSRYPSRVIPELMNLVSFSSRLDYSGVPVPLLQFTSPFDQVVSVRRSLAFFEQWGGLKELVTVQESEDPGFHVITGEIRSPRNTQPFVQAMLRFLETHLP
jgi:pimeloyl-ACP methyl ester carboxylesterase